MAETASFVSTKGRASAHTETFSASCDLSLQVRLDHVDHFIRGGYLP